MESTINTLKVGEKMTKPKQSLAMEMEMEMEIFSFMFMFYALGVIFCVIENESHRD